MHHNATHSVVHQALLDLNPAEADYATEFVTRLLIFAFRAAASDVHLQPTREGLEIKLRLDGVLQTIGTFPTGQITDPINRLKVLAGLLTYRSDVPQEGRIAVDRGESASSAAIEASLGELPEQLELRVSTFPTLHGERAVVRLLGEHIGIWRLDRLGFPPAIVAEWKQLLLERSGALLITGPAGSGKTTSAYASLREIAELTNESRSIVSLEDPIEVAVDGLAQSQVHETAGHTLLSGLKSLLRQDPEVIFLGEIRDRETATVALQAALTGQLMVTTFHAPSAAGAISRLADMGIEPYVLRSGVRGILNQRLVRRLCRCARPGSESDALGLPVTSCKVAQGCEECHLTGYQGRRLLVELFQPGPNDIQGALFVRQDTDTIQKAAVACGMRTILDEAHEAVERGDTSAAEIRRVLGLGSAARGF